MPGNNRRPLPGNEQPGSMQDTGLQPSRLFAAIVAGVVAGAVTIAAEISLAVLIFSGELSGFVSNGIGLLLAGSFAATMVTGIASSYPGMVSPNQDVPAAVVAVMAGAILAPLAATATPEEVYATVVAVIVLSSVLTGVVFLVNGYFRLGGLFRFLPHPVVGGFLAGTGWLLTAGGLSAMAGVSPGLGEVAVLLDGDTWPRWLPGAAFAVALILVLKRYDHYLVMPAMILAAGGLFYLVVLALGVPPREVLEQGWLLGPFPEGGLWQPWSPDMFHEVQWSAIVDQAGNLAAIVIVSTLALLLNAGGLELTVKRDIELDRELKSAGLGSVASGMAGGIISYPALALSALGYRIGGSSRLIPLVVAAMLGLVLYFGPDMLSWTPKLVFGGLLMFLGLSLLEEWVLRAWRRLPLLDFLILVVIVLVIAAVGFLQGVALGAGLAMILFVVSYSRTEVVSRAFSGRHYRSRVIRRDAHQQLLRREADTIHVFQLQGFIFFGTGNKLLSEVRQRIEASDAPPLRFAVLDFKHVTGLDSTALMSFTKLKQLAETRGVTLVFCNTSTRSATGRRRGGVSGLLAQLDDQATSERDRTLRDLPDLDYALEWCEHQVLLKAGADPNDGAEPLLDHLRSLLPGDDTVDVLLEYFERLEVGVGYHLMHQGDPPDALYYVESGQVTLQLESPGRDPIRLETIRGGRIVGEIGFFTNRPRLANVVTDEPSTIYRLTQKKLHEMEDNDPESAHAFQQSVIRILSDRLAQLNEVLRVHA